MSSRMDHRPSKKTSPSIARLRESLKQLRNTTGQRALAGSNPFHNAKPSSVIEVPWLYAVRKDSDYPRKTLRSGKWLIFVTVSHIDIIWNTIKTATEEGKLGSRSKVATMMPRSSAKDPNSRVICVYTYDWRDEADVKRIRQTLRELGIDWKIPYKADRDTRNGKYSIRGDSNISKHYE